MATMNRAARRSLTRTVARAIKGKPGLTHPVPDSVVLDGGPMAGWIVRPEAPALRPDWHTTWSVNVAPVLAGWQPGRYVLGADGKRAAWQGEKLTAPTMRP